MAMTTYEQKIVQAFRDSVVANREKGLEGASPADVTALMATRGQLAALDTVIDIADQMRDLRDQGLL